jgi:hypothetical protein
MQSPPLATALGDIMQANKPKATAGYGHGESATSFHSFGWVSRYLRLDSRRYRLRQRPNVAHSCLLKPAPKDFLSVFKGKNEEV